MSGSDAPREGAYRGGNAVLDGLPPAELAMLLPHLTAFDAEAVRCVVRGGEPIEHVIFPISAVFSTTAQLNGGNQYEVAATGRLGVVGAELALGISIAPRSVLTQVEGSAVGMASDVFARCLGRSAVLRASIERYLLRRLYLAEQFVACNFAHAAAQRCAFWILMVRDEIGRDTFRLRAEYLGMMLGLAPRAAVETADRINATGALRYAAEEVAILDAETLQEISCECYGVQRAFAPA